MRLNAMAIRNGLCCHRTRVSRMPEMRSCLRKRLYVSVSRTVGAYGCTCRPSRATLARLAVQRIVEMQRKSDSPPQAENFRISELPKRSEVLFFKGKTLFGRSRFSKFSRLPPCPLSMEEFSPLPLPNGRGRGSFPPESLLPPPP